MTFIHTERIVIPMIFFCSCLLTWGAGKFGQLGNTRKEDSVQLQDIKHLVPHESGQPIQVSAGCGHSGFITAKGHAYTCGDNRYNQLGMDMSDCHNCFQIVALSNSACCNNDHCILLHAIKLPWPRARSVV